jgi:CcmD family protein
LTSIDSGLLLLLIGYGIVWLGIFGYLVYAVTRLRSVEKELTGLGGGPHDANYGTESPGGD